MLPGRHQGKTVSTVDAYERVGALHAGTVSLAELDALERDCSPTLGSCPGQFTANTMAMVSEVLGLAPLGSAMLPAPSCRCSAIHQRCAVRMSSVVRATGPTRRSRKRWRVPLESDAPWCRCQSRSSHSLLVLRS